MISVGVDVSKGKSTVCILKPYGEILTKFIYGFRPLQQYLFLQGVGFCAEEYDDILTKQLACDPKFVAMCKADLTGVKHVNFGNFKIDRIKKNNKYYDAVCYENIEYVEERFIRDEKGRMNIPSLSKTQQTAS